MVTIIIFFLIHTSTVLIRNKKGMMNLINFFQLNFEGLQINI